MINIFRRPAPGMIPAAPGRRPPPSRDSKLGHTLHFALTDERRRRRGGGLARELRLEFAGRATLRSAGAIGAT